MIRDITNLEDFHTLIAANKVSIIDFSAAWCGPCKFVAPKFEELSEQYSQKIFAKVDIDEVPDAAQEAGIRAMPTFCVFQDGQKIGELVGANPSKLEALCKKYLR